MIRQWEILHYPSDRDEHRYRLSMWSEGGDVAKVRNLFPGRVGAVWIPRRKPYNCAFFLYGILPDEKNDLEEMLSGNTAFPETPMRFMQVQAADPNLTREDTQEVLLIDGVAGETDEVTTGLGGETTKSRTLRVGYFVPFYLAEADEKVHTVLSRTLQEKKVSVTFEKTFSLTYPQMSLSEIHRLLKKCQESAVTRVVAVGDPTHMQALCQIAREGGVFVKPLPESVLDKNLWLTMIAEIIAHE